MGGKLYTCLNSPIHVSNFYCILQALGTFFFILTVQSIALRFTSFSNPDVDLNAPGSFGGPGALAIGKEHYNEDSSQLS